MTLTDYGNKDRKGKKRQKTAAVTDDGIYLAKHFSITFQPFACHCGMILYGNLTSSPILCTEPIAGSIFRQNKANHVKITTSIFVLLTKNMGEGHKIKLTSLIVLLIILHVLCLYVVPTLSLHLDLYDPYPE